ncbi:hypothetical protein FHT82_006102 [Rhizobium sp. BK275]|uniref:hypothetical protein n=1 Tax=unclassified Rhizobium TaxID=2613769 RepID=UPI0016085AD2|nr:MULTISPECIES: hypothetical protein [unclassified Rhizobium]MBB3393308.1 hypothetical protein [Rhizobium sp. BK275]MBB3412028.1 hypothetical protein [Rhizobium sp. BK316]
MTISSEVNRSGPYDANGITTAFEYKFKILEPQHLQVIHTDSSGTDSILMLDADYTVTGIGNDGGGSALITPAPAEGSRITLLLDVPFTQETDLENQGAYYAETVEQALDLIVMRLQQLKERAARAITIPPSFDSATIDKLIADVLALSNKGDALEAVAAVSHYLEAVADLADDIPDVASLTQTTQQKAAEAAQSAADANANAGVATAYATNPEDVAVPGSGGLFSAFHWYRKTLAIYDTVANTLAGWLHGAAAKSDIMDTDEFAIADNAAGWGLRKVLAGSIVKYVARALDLDFMVGFIPAWASTTSISIGPGVGFFGGKRHATTVDTTRQLSATFGTGTGFLDTGVVQASKTYFIYAIRNLDTGATDFVASLSAIEGGVSLTNLTGWELLSGSRVGILLTNASAQIHRFKQTGNFVQTVASNEVNTSAAFTNDNMRFAFWPVGVPVLGRANSSIVANSNNGVITLKGGVATAADAVGESELLVQANNGTGTIAITDTWDIHTRTDGTFRLVGSSAGGSINISISSSGWTDYTCKRLLG